MVKHSLAVVGFTLVPDGSFYSVGQQGGDHGIVHVCGRSAPRLTLRKLIQFVSMACLECGYGLEAFRRSPRLDACAAPVGTDQPDGHFDFLMEVASKEITDCGEVRHGGGAADLPSAGLNVVLRRKAQFVRHLDVPDERMLGVGDFLLGIGGSRNGPFHVRLSRAKPDLTDEYIAQRDFVGTLDHEVGSFCIGFGCGELDLPFAILAGFGGNLGIVEGDGDFLTGIGPTPDGEGFALLEHHVAAENGGQLDRGRGNGSDCEKGQAGT